MTHDAEQTLTITQRLNHGQRGCHLDNLTYQYVFTDKNGVGIPDICSIEGTGTYALFKDSKVALNRIIEVY